MEFAEFGIFQMRKKKEQKNTKSQNNISYYMPGK